MSCIDVITKFIDITVESISMEFTYSVYETLLQDLFSAGYDFNGYEGPLSGKSTVLRHDVDWSPRKAVKMAEIEADMDIASSYFFLITSQFYNAFNEETRAKIERILSLGHDVGLHFSTHQYWQGEEMPEKEMVAVKVNSERRALSGLLEEKVDVVSFHNPPEWVFREEYEGFVSTYEPRFFEEIEYTADSNQRWRENPPLQSELPDRLQLLVHPVLWGDNDADVIERLREERNHVFDNIEQFMIRENDVWR